MLSNRLKRVLPSIISANQSAFVVGWTIVQNILICQDLVRLYNRKQTTSSCLIKIDLKIAYDTVEWDFVEEMLYALEFPQKCIKWIMNCVTTVQYSITINGGLYGSIKGKRGLRQEDLISPLLFVICMECFTRIMNVVAEQQGFKFHTKCRSLKLNHLCFANDVLIFSKRDFQTVLLLLRGLKTFSNATGLCTNTTKSNIFSVNMPVQSMQDLIELTGYTKGSLPFRYLGVPMSAKRISKMDCEMLIDKITARIRSWGTRYFSYAGRVLLVNSVLLHIHSYWSSIFLLPKQVLKGITALCKNFLWDGKTAINRVTLVAWDLVCRAKREGGLGITDCFK
ncbi:uncharacterized protein LOC132627306 [Lycium barbarum]|uniref:uncharacterized protein LOC132627306 n=1 Tax=Lycium barbarum TaxID=112863 RepID=UPI00293E249E|nr:uncharacterized protein LOC132627306 [Lycium barbarum]